MEEWSIRSMLNPVIARLLIYGVNPNDLEYVLAVVEKQNLVNVRLLEKTWITEWEKKAARYQALGEEAVGKNRPESARNFFLFAAQCYYAIFLINQKNLGDKKRIYQQYANFYQKSVSYYRFPVEVVEVPLGNGQALPAYFHHPYARANEVSPGAGTSPCVIVFSGLGSSKEEMRILAEPLVERGIGVLIPDMPGSGAALFERDIKCRLEQIQTAFTRLVDYLETRNDIRPEAIGAYGLCMGGGYAHRAACADSRYKFCVTLFPLFITRVEDGATPQWMKQGEWYNYQTGDIPGSDFLAEMQSLEAGELTCPYLFIHGEHDNWMTIASAMQLFDRAKGEKDKIIIAEEPVFSNQQIVTHTMPVGEQLHWVRHVAADWIKDHCR
ncbi:MAG TPA: prolyl oligopeptidase family serine peptidase [Bacillota bacterium]|nr:prolyl oligopeptidase family serine peptidase [Bacillota bacterium]